MTQWLSASKVGHASTWRAGLGAEPKFACELTLALVLKPVLAFELLLAAAWWLAEVLLATEADRLLAATSGYKAFINKP